MKKLNELLFRLRALFRRERLEADMRDEMRHHLDKPQEHTLLLGLIEDAVRNVSWWAPELDGAKFVTGIRHWLLAGFDDYSSEEPRKDVLQVIAKIPNADAARFEAGLRGTVREGQRRDHNADDFPRPDPPGLWPGRRPAERAPPTLSL